MKSRRSRRRRRWPLLAAGVASLFALLLWFAPALIATCGVPGRVINSALGDSFEGTVSLGEISLGWLAPVTLRDIRVDDAEGNRVLDVASVRGDKPLWQLLGSRRDLGRWIVSRPHARLILDGQSSNIEKLLAGLPAGEQDATTEIPRAVVELIEGRVEWRERGAAVGTEVTGIQGELQVAGENGSELAARLSARVQASDAQSPAGTLHARAEWNDGGAAGPAGNAPAGAGRLAVECRDLDLAVLDPLLRRLQLDVQARGVLSADAVLGMAGDGAACSVHLASLDGRNIHIRWPDQLGPEPVALPYVRGSGTARLEGESLHLEGVAIDCDVARLEAEGRLALAAFMTPGASHPSGETAAVEKNTPAVALETLSAQSGRILVEVDLARAAAVMPRLLRVREDTHIESGRVRVEWLSRDEGDGPRWIGHVSSSDLAAVRGTQRLTWSQPLTVDLTARLTPAGLVVDQLHGDGQFVTLEGSGSLDAASLSVHADLNQLKSALDQFLDLRDVALQGRLQGELNWKRDADQRFAIDGLLLAEEFELSPDPGRIWREPRLTVTVEAAGRAGENWQPRSLEKVLVKVVAGQDQCSVALVEPVEDLSRAAGLFRGSARGTLPTWAARLRPFLPLSGYDLDGSFDVEFEASAAPDRWDLASARLTARNVRVRGGGLFIDEPQLEAAGKASFLPESGRLTVAEATLASSALGMRVSELAIFQPAGGEGPRGAAGRLVVRGDLERLVAWVTDPATPRMVRWAGTLDGQWTLAQSGSTTTLVGSSAVTELAMLKATGGPAPRPAARRNQLHPNGRGPNDVAASGSSWRTVWSEPRLEVRGELSMEAEQEKQPRVVLRNLQGSSPGSGIACRVAGTMTDPSGRMMVDVSGELDYDLAIAVHRLRDLVGPQLQVSGRQQRTFFLKGPLRPGPEETAAHVTVNDPPGALAGGSSVPLVSADLAGEAALGWESVGYLGMQVGAGQLMSRLEGGVVRVDPLDLAVNQGRLQMEPRIDFNQTPALLSLKPGPLIREVQITPEVFRGWMRYVTPLLADATRAEGKFSVDLEQAELPLGQPDRATTVGRLTVHGALVGPGPLAQQLLTIADQMRAVMQQRAPTSSPGASSPGGSGEWIRMPPQAIDIQLVDGRMHHRGLQLVVDDVVIFTEGSVGLDETILLEARIPVREEWIARQPRLASLRGQVLRLPIRGTLSQPRVDSSALKSFSRDALRKAAGQLLEKELGRGLQQLFGPAPSAKP